MPLMLLAASLALNLLALAAAVVFVRRKGGLAYLKSKLASRGVIADPALERFERAYYRTKTELFALFPPGPGDVVMLGDSLTDAGPWREFFADRAIKNQGISGDTVAGVLHRLPAVAAARPAAICLMIGINDLNNGEPPESVVATYGRVLDLLRSQTPETRVVVQGLLPVDTFVWGVATGRRVEAFNALLAALAAERGLPYLDLYPTFALERRLDPACSYDGLHLNTVGYLRWRDALAPVLEAALTAPRSA